MSSFICKNAPWRYRPCVSSWQIKCGYTHVVVSGAVAYFLHRSEKQAARMAERLNYLAALEIMTGKSADDALDAYD